MTQQVEPNRYMLLLKSMWSWDLWAAIAVTIVLGAAWIMMAPDPRWEWFTPLIIFSLSITWGAWSQWASLRSRLQDSPYGELIRLSDKCEHEARLPYLVTLFIAFFSALCALLTATLIESLTGGWANVLVIITGFLAAWMIFAMVSLWLLSVEHDKNIAEITSMKEEMEAAQRQYEAEKRRHAATQESQQETSQEP